MRSLRRGIIARSVASGTVVLVVLALVGVVFALHNAAGSAPRAAGRVTATTPPDTVHVVVTTETGHTLVPDPNATNCPAGIICLTSAATDVSGTPYDHTFTDATTVQRLQNDLNSPALPGNDIPTCGAAGSPEALLYSASVQTDDFTFTAGGQTIEHVVISFRCGLVGVRGGFAPDLNLGAEHGWPSGLLDALIATYPNMPSPAFHQSVGTGRPPAQPTP